MSSAEVIETKEPKASITSNTAADRQQWRPVHYNPGQSNAPPVPPPPVPPLPGAGDITDTEADDLPAVPPKPQRGTPNTWPSNDSSIQTQVYTSSSPKIPAWQNGKPGVWQPGQSPDDNDDYNNQEDAHDVQPVWTPSSTPSAKKEFRSVRPPQQAYKAPQAVQQPVQQQAPPSPIRRQPSPPVQRRQQPPVHTAVHHAPPSPKRQQPARVTPSDPPPAAPPQTPQRATSRKQPPKKPHVTVITDPAQIPTGALYQKITIDGDKIHTDTYYPMEEKPKHETTNLNEQTKQKVGQKAPNYEGIGPRDHESGMPLGLRQHVEEDKRHDWYKEMYKSIHKQERDEDGNPLVASYEMTEPPTPLSDHAKPPFEAQPKKPPPSDVVVSTPVNRYRQQPRSIVDYEPGKSSLVGTDKAPIEPQRVHQSYSAAPPQRSGYASDDEGHRARQRSPASPVNQNNPGINPHISGKDKNYNYKNSPPHNLDKAALQKIMDAEKHKRALADRELQDSRRHSDFTPKKGPIITDERFRELLKDAKPIDDNTGKKETRACALALYDFAAQSPKELSFKKGDTLYLTKEVDKNWYKGEHHGRIGIFPKAYVEVVTSIDEARKIQLSLPGKEGKAKAKFKFRGETKNELSFNKHDYIDLIQRIDSNWWEGRIGVKTGILPDSYIDVLKQPEVKSPMVSPTGGIGAQLSPASRGGQSPGREPQSPSARSPTRRAPPQQVRQPASPGRVVDDRLTQTQAVPVQSQPSYHHQRGPALHHSSITPQSQPQHQRAPPLQQQHQPTPAAQTYTVDRMSPTPITRQPQDQYQAMFNYLPQNEDELELQDGDRVVVLEKCDDGWFVGTSLRTGMFGTFPGNYVSKV